MFKELDCIVLTTDISEDGRKKADVGTIVHAYPEGNAYIMEFLTPDGDTAAVTEVLPSQMRAVSESDITRSHTMKIKV